jgi:hypothetical protein
MVTFGSLTVRRDAFAAWASVVLLSSWPLFGSTFIFLAPPFLLPRDATGSHRIISSQSQKGGSAFATGASLDLACYRLKRANRVRHPARTLMRDREDSATISRNLSSMCSRVECGADTHINKRPLAARRFESTMSDGLGCGCRTRHACAFRVLPYDASSHLIRIHVS